MDLNGDGDIADFVCHVHDSSSAATTNTMLASAFDIFASVDIIAILVRESHQGNADLNGDGDTADDVIHVYEPCTGAVTNLGLSVPFSGASIFLDGPIAAFTASEASIGLDLNGDGDAVDRVPHVYDARTGTLHNISVSGDVVGLSATSIILVLGEASNDNTDFNGDGDVADSVALIYDAHTGLLSNTGLAVFTFSDSIETSTLFLTIIVPEASQGSTDLNGDGDALDSVLHLYNLRTQAVFNTSLSARAVLGDRLVALRARESEQGNTDLNGDGDTDDAVLHALDLRSLLIHNLGVSSTADFTVSGLFFTFQASESSEGDTDLNGDGDTFDDVYHVYDSRLRVTRNLGIATRPPQGDRALISPSFAAFLVRESSQGTDLNGDGDLFDRVPHLLDLRTGVLTNIALAVGSITMDGSLLFFDVSEPGNGRTDLNGDGDALDSVLHLYDANTSSLINLRIEAIGRSQAQHLLAFSIFEPECGEDLNGDGDVLDFVVHVLGQSCQTGTVGSAAGPVANVLSVNGQTNTAFVPMGDPIQVAFGAPPLGPAPASYVLWVWTSSPLNPTTLRAQGRILGCTQNPTPLIPSLFPQPFRCLRSPSLPATLCAGVVQIAGAPPGAPWALERSGGFMQRGEFLLQGLVEDKGASNLIGYSVTNAVTLKVH